jgi:hypothetical protein
MLQQCELKEYLDNVIPPNYLGPWNAIGYEATGGKWWDGWTTAHLKI